MPLNKKEAGLIGMGAKAALKGSSKLFGLVAGKGTLNKAIGATVVGSAGYSAGKKALRSANSYKHLGSQPFHGGFKFGAMEQDMLPLTEYYTEHTKLAGKTLPLMSADLLRRTLAYGALAAGVGAALSVGEHAASTVMSKGVMALTKANDFNRMLRADDQWSESGLKLKDQMKDKEDAAKIRIAYASLRNLHPRLARDPLLAAAAVKRTIRRSEDVLGAHEILSRLKPTGLFDAKDNTVTPAVLKGIVGSDVA